MDRYIDFSNCQKDFGRFYGGANGNKICVWYENERYMLKFNTQINDTPTNGIFCEYLGSHIFNSVGIPAQETVLGEYKGIPVVGCKDFVKDGEKLIDFASLKNSVLQSSHNGYGKELSDVLLSIRQQEVFPPAQLESHFWDQYIVDSFLGNFDRHNGNWGFIVDAKNKLRFAPVFDCGSCLYPRQTEETMKKVLASEEEINNRIYVFPNATFKAGKNKISYFDHISSLEDTGANEALKRIVPRIKMNGIRNIIENTPKLTDIEKEFYFTMLKERKTKILDYSLCKLREKEKQLGKQKPPASLKPVQKTNTKEDSYER